MLEFSKSKSAFNGKYEFNIKCDRCGKILGTGHESRNNIQTQNLCTKCAFDVFNSEKHQKRKRCLAMAELCCERKENCYNIALRKYTKSEADLLVKKSEFWEEWEDTWVQLAYRFNETYNENKNQEEQTAQ